MKITGKLVEVMATQQVSDGFKKRTFIIEHTENPLYPEYISFELIQDRCDLVDSFELNQEITVSFNLKGRKWVNPQGETKYFNSLQAWRLEAMDQQDATLPSQTVQEVEKTLDDELPF
jgi:hypothetical protein